MQRHVLAGRFSRSSFTFLAPAPTIVSKKLPDVVLAREKRLLSLGDALE